MRIGQVLEKPALALRLIGTTELPADERHDLSILVHEPLHVNQEISPIEFGQVFLYVRIDRAALDLRLRLVSGFFQISGCRM